MKGDNIFEDGKLGATNREGLQFWIGTSYSWELYNSVWFLFPYPEESA